MRPSALPLSNLSPPAAPGQTLDASLAAQLLFPALTALALGAWVYADAAARADDHPLRRAALVTAFPPLVALYVRSRGERTRPQSDRERLALALLLGLLSALLAGMAFSPPDVILRPRTTFAASLVTLPLFYLLVYRQTADEGGDGADRGEGEDETG